MSIRDRILPKLYSTEMCVVIIAQHAPHALHVILLLYVRPVTTAINYATDLLGLLPPFCQCH